MGGPSKAEQLAAVAKAGRGEVLTEKEQEAQRAYYAATNERRAAINWESPEELAACKAAAEAAGFRSFSRWVVEMVRRGMDASRHTQDEWDLLVEQRDVAERRLEQQLEMSHELMAKASKYEAERDEARHELYEALERIRDLVEAKRHA